MNSISSENELLLSACRLYPDNNINHKLGVLTDSFDWELLVNSAFHHGVTGLLCSSLVAATPGLVPEEIIDAAEEHLKQQQEKNQTQANQLTGILDELDRTGIQAIPFKGLTLAMSAYGSLNLRSSRDLDILIHKEDRQSCINRLGELGYIHETNLTPRQWQEFLDYAGEEILFGPGVPIEPHWAFAPRTLAIRLDYAAVRDRAREITFNNQSILSLSPEDELIVLCIHGCKEEWAKLKWVIDVAEFMRSQAFLNWSDVINRASSQGVARIVRIGILLAVELVQIEIPDYLNDWAKGDTRAVSLVKDLTDEFFSKDKSELDIWKPGYFHWAMRERLRDRFLYLLLTLTQPRIQHFADIHIPDQLFLLYWPYRFLHDFIALPIWKIIKKLRPAVIKDGTG